MQVLDVQPSDRHLLLMVRHEANRAGRQDTKEKFLCGHDERHWFVAGVSDSVPVSSVVTAKEALKPDAVRSRERGKRGKRAKRQGRKTDVFIRQGEWFFIPAPDVQVNQKLILTNEPIRRGRGKPHVCEELYRDGGTTVYVCRQHPNGLTVVHYRKLLKVKPGAAKWRWQVMRRDPVAYVRGRISHPDHSTNANSLSAKAAPLRKAPSTRGPEHQSPQAPMFASPSNRYRSGSGSVGSA